MIKSITVAFLLLPAICQSLECVFQTDPVHPINPHFEDRNITGVKQYECSAGDKYCVYFEGNMETTGQNQTFSVRACESDLMHYLNPIGDKIGHKLQVKCQKEGTVEKNVGAFTYFINCCTDSDCDKKDTNSASSAKWIGSILFASLMAFAYNF